MTEGKLLSILICKEGDMFVAQCLEHDIAVQAPDFDTLKARFEATMSCEVNDHGGLDAIPPAPAEFREKWDSALALRDSADNTEMRLAA